MKKQILLRSALGFPLGVCISNGILLIFAVCFGEYFPCAPDCAARFGSEVAGAAVQFFRTGGGGLCRKFGHLGGGVVESAPSHRHALLHHNAHILGGVAAAGMVRTEPVGGAVLSGHFPRHLCQHLAEPVFCLPAEDREDQPESAAIKNGRSAPRTPPVVLSYGEFWVRTCLHKRIHVYFL